MNERESSASRSGEFPSSLIDVDGYILEDEGQNKDIRPPFIFVNPTSETPQITVNPNRLNPIACQIAVSW